MASNVRLQVVNAASNQDDLMVRLEDGRAESAMAAAVKVIRAVAPSLPLARRSHDEATCDPMVRRAQTISGFTRGIPEGSPSLSSVAETSGALSVAPCLSFSPMVSSAPEGLRLMAASLDPASITGGFGAGVAKQLDHLLALKDFFELETISLFVDPLDEEIGTQAADHVTTYLHQQGESGIAVMTVEEGLRDLVANPRSHGVLLTLSTRGAWVETVAQALVGAQEASVKGYIAESFGFCGAVHSALQNGEQASDTPVYEPGSFLLAGILMMVDMGLQAPAASVFNAWLKAIEDGFHTREQYNANLNARMVDHDGFADAIIKRIGEKPRKLAALEKALDVFNETHPRANLRIVS